MMCESGGVPLRGGVGATDEGRGLPWETKERSWSESCGSGDAEGDGMPSLRCRAEFAGEHGLLRSTTWWAGSVLASGCRMIGRIFRCDVVLRAVGAPVLVPTACIAHAPGWPGGEDKARLRARFGTGTSGIGTKSRWYSEESDDTSGLSREVSECRVNESESLALGEPAYGRRTPPEERPNGEPFDGRRAHPPRGVIDLAVCEDTAAPVEEIQGSTSLAPGRITE